MTFLGKLSIGLMVVVVALCLLANVLIGVTDRAKVDAQERLYRVRETMRANTVAEQVPPTPPLDWAGCLRVEVVTEACKLTH